MKKYFLSLVFIVVGFQSLASINHGSAIGKNLPLYPIRNGSDPTAPVAGVTFDYKVVTIGTKTWVWTNLNGKHIAANNWSSQIRFLYPDKQEYNLLNRVVNTQQTYGIAGLSDVDPCAVAFPDADSYVITFVQQVNTDFYETADIVYNHTQPSPLPETDYTPPVMNFSAIASRTDKQLRLSLSASDDSENFFYYIEDAANGIMEISFSDEAVLNIETGKYYHFSVCAIDFSGNQSETLLTSHLPDSIRNGSDFYVIYMDAEGEESLGTKVKEKSMLRSYDIWNGTLTTATRTDVNAWGINVSDSWVALDVAAGAKEIGWNGGAIVADLSGFKSRPNLKEITDNPNDYYFHFAIRSPAGKPSAGWTLIFYSDGTPDGLKYYYVGPDTGTDSLHGLSRLGDYTGNGEWQHFEIPVSQLVLRGYKWNGPLTGEKQYLLGFQSPANVPGTELNLDAVFFYKKAESVDISTPVLSNSGTAMAISFKVDSRSLNALQIICTTDATASNPFVTLELDGVEVIGRWEPVTDWRNSQNKYLFVIPATEIRGWATGAIFGLNFGYSRNDGNLVTDNKVITNGANSGKRILHKTGTGDDISNLPDSISNGSDFYNIYMDVVSEASLGEKVKEKNMIRDIEIWGETLTSGKNRSGVNAFDVPDNWVALDVVGDAKGVVGNGGAIVANLSEFEKAPNLKDITDNPDDYCLHFAVKRPSDQLSKGLKLTLYSDNKNLRYYVGPETESALNLLWLGDYTGNGEWQHFEIPVSQMVALGYKWNEPLSGDNGKRILLGFEAMERIRGTEINLDAIFFYKKPNYTAPVYSSSPKYNEGATDRINFKLDSRTQNELRIMCTTTENISNPFVELFICGTKIIGRTTPEYTDFVPATKRYLITIPLEGYGNPDAFLNLNFGYTLDGNEVIENTTADGMPILHKTGEGVNISYLPDDISNGSDFYIITMDPLSEASLGNKVKEKKIMHGYDVENDPESIDVGSDATTVNTFGVHYPWLSFRISGLWAAVTIFTNYSAESGSRPDLSSVTDNPQDYYLHIAAKGKEGGNLWGRSLYLDFYSDGGVYSRDDSYITSMGGAWLHIDIPVSDLTNSYKWNGPLNPGKVNLIKFELPVANTGDEINLDAIFFYKKP
jgi:hypothetical protein